MEMQTDKVPNHIQYTTYTLEGHQTQVVTAIMTAIHGRDKDRRKEFEQYLPRINVILKPNNKLVNTSITAYIMWHQQWTSFKSPSGILYNPNGSQVSYFINCLEEDLRYKVMTNETAQRSLEAAEGFV